MKIPNGVTAVWVERMSADIDYFARIEDGVLILRIYQKKNPEGMLKMEPGS